MKNLAHSASFESLDKDAPSNAGTKQLTRGELRIRGEVRKFRGPAEAIEEGVALVPEDRQVQGLVLDHSIERNFSLPRLPHFSWASWVRRGAETAETVDAIARLSIKAPGPLVRVRTLSGGNQQKVVFAKWINARTRILLLDEPTVGVDVGAREEIYRLIRAAVGSGAGALIASSDLNELILLCDRISIVVDGRVTATLAHSEFGDVESLHQLIQTEQEQAA
jgi:ribose transport system ATP-binding protein